MRRIWIFVFCIVTVGLFIVLLNRSTPPVSSNKELPVIDLSSAEKVRLIPASLPYQKGIDKITQASVPGVLLGVVADTDDPEGLGRVKVNYVLSSKVYSSWARVALFAAGNENGAWFIPSADDEVLLAFENGNINSPYVIGSLWNGVNRPPAINSGNSSDVQEIVSKSGNKITINSGDGHDIIEIVDRAGNHISLHPAEGSITIESSVEININAPFVNITSGSMKVESSGILELQSPLVNIEGQVIINGQPIEAYSH